MNFDSRFVLAFVILLSTVQPGCSNTEEEKSDGDKIDEFCLKNDECIDAGVSDDGDDVGASCGDFFASAVGTEWADCDLNCPGDVSCEEWWQCVLTCEKDYI